jgi:hypothetical protein
VSEGDAGQAIPPQERGWYPVPDNPNYQRFWTGRSWTEERYWGGAAEQSNSPVSDRGPDDAKFVPPTNWRQPSTATTSRWDTGAAGELQKYYALQLIFGAPVFLLVAALFMISAGPPGVLFGLLFAVLVALIATRTSYLAIVHSDGSLTFKSLIGSKNTNVSRVTRIAFGRNRGGASWTFEFDGTKAQLVGNAGKALARCVISSNPGVEYPSGLQ